MKSAILLTLGFIIGQMPSPANAELYDRGNGLIFDSTLNITWQQNANLASSNTFDLPIQSTGGIRISADGSMNWPGALMWIDAMNAVSYLGYSDWRLPRINSPFGFNLSCTSYDGSTDCGYNITDTRNELAHLFYSSLANIGSFDTQGNPNPPQSLNAGLFINFQEARYWTGTQLPPAVGPNEAFTFSIGSGLKEWDAKVNPYHIMSVWAVRTGDVAVVPEPSALLMLLAGLAAGITYLRYQKCYR